MPNFFINGLELSDSYSVIEVKVCNAFCQEFNRIVPGKLNSALKTIHNDLFHVFKGSPIYRDIEGTLGAELGIPAGTGIERLDAIFKKFCEEIEIVFKPIRFVRKFTGGIEVHALKTSFKELLQLEEAKIADAQRGYVLPWLRWMLYQGDKIIISRHHVKFGRYPYSTSRSGKAIMVKGDTSFWRVPPGWSGTKDNNFITRQIQRNMKYFEKAISDAIERAIYA